MSQMLSTVALAPPQRRHRRHANPLAHRAPPASLDVSALFGRDAPLALDVGCGPGAFTAQLAERSPQWNVLGVEIRQHLVDEANALFAQSAAASAAAPGPRAQAVLANVNSAFLAQLAPRSVALVTVNFPDPWFKRRHHKRRVLNAAFLAALADKLAPGAQLLWATDYRPLALAMRRSCLAARYRDQFAADVWPQHSLTGIDSERECAHRARGETIWRGAFAAPMDPQMATDGP